MCHVLIDFGPDDIPTSQILTRMSWFSMVTIVTDAIALSLVKISLSMSMPYTLIRRPVLVNKTIQ